jgi:hypothetical protein
MTEREGCGRHKEQHVQTLEASVDCKSQGFSGSSAGTQQSVQGRKDELVSLHFIILSEVRFRRPKGACIPHMRENMQLLTF